MPDPTTTTEQASVVTTSPDRRYMSYAEFNGRNRRSPQPPRFAAISDYRKALEDLTSHLEKFPIYDDEAILPLWVAKNIRRHTQLIDVLGRFNEHIHIHTEPDPNEPIDSERAAMRAADVGAALSRAWLAGITVNVAALPSDESSPSDGCDDSTAGDGSVAGGEEAPATESNSEAGERDASMWIARKTALLEDAVSRRAAVFVRIRELSAQPPSEWLCGHLAELGSELNQHTLQVHRRTAQLEQARAAENPQTGCEQHPGEACGRVPASHGLGRTTRRRRY